MSFVFKIHFIDIDQGMVRFHLPQYTINDFFFQNLNYFVILKIKEILTKYTSSQAVLYLASFSSMLVLKFSYFPVAIAMSSG